jgi:hypothetical protein
MTCFVFHLISQIPVSHIDATIWGEELFTLLYYLYPLFSRREMMERGEEEERVE